MHGIVLVWKKIKNDKINHLPWRKTVSSCKNKLWQQVYPSKHGLNSVNRITNSWKNILSTSFLTTSARPVISPALAFCGLNQRNGIKAQKRSEMQPFTSLAYEVVQTPIFVLSVKKSYKVCFAKWFFLWKKGARACVYRKKAVTLRPLLSRALSS